MRPGTRVLLVEDDRSIVRLVQMGPEHRGFDVGCDYDGPSGLEEVERLRPEVVVLNIMLPGLDGVGARTWTRPSPERNLRRFSESDATMMGAPSPPGRPARERPRIGR